MKLKFEFTNRYYTKLFVHSFHIYINQIDKTTYRNCCTFVCNYYNYNKLCFTIIQHSKYYTLLHFCLYLIQLYIHVELFLQEIIFNFISMGLNAAFGKYMLFTGRNTRDNRERGSHAQGVYLTQ